MPPILGVVGGLVEWLFAFPQRLSVTISNGDRLVDMPREELAQAIWRDVCKAAGVQGDLPPWQIVRERRATFRGHAGAERAAAGAGHRFKNLFLAGDWTDTGLPATIEGSVRSGDRAADLVLAMRRPDRAADRSRTGAEIQDVERYAFQQCTQRTLAVDPPRWSEHRLGDARAARLPAADGHWVFELEADAPFRPNTCCCATISASRSMRARSQDRNYLRRIQGAHGGWPLVHDGDFDMSASVKAYFALKMIGDSVDAPHMRARARRSARAAAPPTATSSPVSLLALFGVLTWRSVPVLPVEIMLLPMWSPFHLNKISYWARTTIVPLLVLAALKAEGAQSEAASASTSCSCRSRRTRSA
jgi:hypothetical protein